MMAKRKRIGSRYGYLNLPLPERVIGCMIPWGSNYNPLANVRNTCTFPDNSNRILILEEYDYRIQEHGIYCEMAFKDVFGPTIRTMLSGLGNRDIDGFNKGWEFAKDTLLPYVSFSYSGRTSFSEEYFRLYYDKFILCMPHFHNAHNEAGTDFLSPIISCAAGTTENETSYGQGSEFWDDGELENINPGIDYQSNATPTIMAKIVLIKEGRGCSPWEARYVARVTADRNESRRPTGPNGKVLWTKEDGFGKINVAQALSWTGTIPPDPFLNNSNPYIPFIP